MDKPYDTFDALMQKVKNNEKLLSELADLTKDSATSLGLLLRHPQFPDTLKTAPVTLFPTLVSNHAISEIVQIQCDINHLMHLVAHDREFLNEVLQGASSVDPFIWNLLDIYNQIDVSKQTELGLFRSDYILHVSPQNGDEVKLENALKSATYKQVEVNTICIGLAGLGSKVHIVHDRTLKFLGENIVQEDGVSGEPLSLYGKALSLAHSVYATNHPSPRTKIILILIHKGFEFNIMDQRFVEFESGIPAIRRCFEQIRTSITVEDGILFVEGHEVAVVYFRTGYTPG